MDEMITTYADWLKVVREIKVDGLNEDRYRWLSQHYPENVNISYTVLIYNQLTDLENSLLSNCICKFEKIINQAMDDSDMELANMAVVRLINDLKKSMFFLKYECISEADKKKLQNMIYSNVLQFQTELKTYLKKFIMNNGNDFIQDLIYLFTKKNISNMILEWRIHE